MLRVWRKGVDQVMDSNETHFHLDEFLERLKRRLKTNLPPEKARQTLERVCQALSGRALVHVGEVESMGRKLAAAIVLLVVVGIGVAWLIPTSAFRQFQKALMARSSITCKVTRDSKRSVRVLILDSGCSRIEWPDGNYTIADNSKSRKLFVNPMKREARLEYYGSPNLYEHEVLKGLQNARSVRVLPSEEQDGRDVLGFLVPHVDDYDVTAWVDTNSKLPVRIETKYWDKGDTGRVTIIDDFVIDEKLDAELFTLEPRPDTRLGVSTSLSSRCPRTQNSATRW